MRIPISGEDTLANSILQATGDAKVSFHTPGHLYGRALPCWQEDWFGRLDTTELAETDNLSLPQGMLKAAQERAAKAFGAKRTHYLVNGSTCGILAMIIASVGRGEEIIVGRDCHKSVLNALKLSGGIPVFVDCQAQSQGMLPHGPSKESYLEAITSNPRAKALLLTRPNYYGVAVEIEAISEELKKREMLFLVDEAHGAHFAASQLLPKPALSCGADLVVQSLHKTLPSPTQTALLHEGYGFCGVKAGKIITTVNEAIALFQTTSPSWPFMACMDSAIAWMSEHGSAEYSELKRRIDGMKKMLGCATTLKAVSTHQAGYSADFSRIVVSVPSCGFELGRKLRKAHHIAVEMAEQDRLVLIATPFHREEDFKLLADAILAEDRKLVADAVLADDIKLVVDAVLADDIRLAADELLRDGFNLQADNVLTENFKLFTDKASKKDRSNEEKSLSQTKGSGHKKTAQKGLSYREALSSPKILLKPEEALGFIAAAEIAIFPPGVSLLIPGEVIREPAIISLLAGLENGAVITGLDEGCVPCVDTAFLP